MSKFIMKTFRGKLGIVALLHVFTFSTPSQNCSSGPIQLGKVISFQSTNSEPQLHKSWGILAIQGDGEGTAGQKARVTAQAPGIQATGT